MIEWNIIRAAGIGAFIMLWGSVAWGLVSTTSVFGKRIPKATSIALHQAFSTSGLLFLALHLGFLLADRFMPFAPLDLVIPMRATYRPIGVSLGIASMFVVVLGVLATSWGRKLIGTTWWRRTHALSVPAFALALMHGLMTGTDSKRPAMFWMYLLSAAILLFLLLLRGLNSQRPQRAPLPEGAVRKEPERTTTPSAHAIADPAPRPRSRPRPPSSAKPPVPVVIVKATMAGAPPDLSIGPDRSNGAQGRSVRGPRAHQPPSEGRREHAARPPPTNHGRDG
ncbi:MAG: ferric reductase-like transmembrane domain-containing protein [Actinomycetota bacterium]